MFVQNQKSNMDFKGQSMSRSKQWSQHKINFLPKTSFKGVQFIIIEDLVDL